MKIGPPDNKPAQSPAPRALERAGDKAAANSAVGRAVAALATPAPVAPPPADPTPDSAQVVLSSEAAALSAAPEGEFDQAKVDRIATAIREGRYRVNPEAIAERLIANARELLQPRPTPDA